MYLIFGGELDHLDGGANDFLCANSDDELRSAIDKAESLVGTEVVTFENKDLDVQWTIEIEWVHIFDTETSSIVYKNKGEISRFR